MPIVLQAFAFPKTVHMHRLYCALYHSVLPDSSYPFSAAICECMTSTSGFSWNRTSIPPPVQVEQYDYSLAGFIEAGLSVTLPLGTAQRRNPAALPCT